MGRRFRNKRHYLKNIADLMSRYRSIVEGSLIGVFIFQNKKLVYVNKYVEKCFGFSESELYNMSWQNLVSKDNHKKVSSILQKLHYSSSDIFLVSAVSREMVRRCTLRVMLKILFIKVLRQSLVYFSI